MANAEQTLQVYERLAEWYDQEGQPKLRDWFLVLAADAAQTAGQADEAERLRGRLLQRNPHHLLKPFASFAEALRSPDVLGYVADLRRTYPPAAAEQLLKTQQVKNAPGTPAAEPPAAPRAAEKPAPAAKPRPAAPPPEESELKVYRVRAEPEELDPPALPIPRQAPPPRPAPRSTAPPAPVAAPAAPASRMAPPPVLRSRPAPEKEPATPGFPPPVQPHYTAPDAPPEPEPATTGVTTGAWLPTILFVLLLLLSLGLAGYTLARPFLPEDWFR